MELKHEKCAMNYQNLKIWSDRKFNLCL